MSIFTKEYVEQMFCYAEYLKAKDKLSDLQIASILYTHINDEVKKEMGRIRNEILTRLKNDKAL